MIRLGNDLLHGFLLHQVYKRNLYGVLSEGELEQDRGRVPGGCGLASRAQMPRGKSFKLSFADGKWSDFPLCFSPGHT